MTWTNEQFSTFCVLLDDGWPGEFTEQQFASWRTLLEPVEPRAAGEALVRLLHGGQRFRPSVAELLGEVRKDHSTPTFDEAYQLIFGPGGLTTAHVLGRSLPSVHHLVASFAQRQGLDRLASLPVDDPEWGSKHRKDLNAAWGAHCEAMDGREVAVLASGGRTGLRQLDPLAALPQIEKGGEAA